MLLIALYLVALDIIAIATHLAVRRLCIPQQQRL